MPIVFEQRENSSISYAIWHITESEEFFHSLLTLTTIDTTRINNYKQQQARLEKWACRAIVAHLINNSKVKISYTSKGKPLLLGQHLSFSHSHGLAAAAIAPYPIGIDIEKINPKIIPLHTKFMSPQEIEDAKKNWNENNLTFYWCAKEAMYKLQEPLPYNLKEGLQVLSENCGKIYYNDNILTVNLQKTIFLNYQIVIASNPSTQFSNNNIPLP